MEENKNPENSLGTKEPVGSFKTYSEKTDKDMDDAGSVFGNHKKMFMALAGIVAIYVVAFLLQLFGIISMLTLDCILLPVTVVIVLAYMRQKKR